MDNPNQNNIVQPNGSADLFSQNPKLKKLLLVLIMVLLFSGVGLTVFAYQQSIYREKLYYETEAGLPIHRNNTPTSPSACIPLPAEISNNPVYVAWLKTHKLEGQDVCGQQPFTLQTSDSIENFSCDTTSQYSGKQFISPDKQRSICMGSFGEPDSVVIFSSKLQEDQGEIKSCGTPCIYENGFWIDKDRFVLLETDDIDGSGQNLSHLAHLFNFNGHTKQIWEVINLQWKTYRNEEYGFEITFTDAWKGYKVIKQTIQNVPIITFSVPTQDWKEGYAEYLFIHIFLKTEWEQLNSVPPDGPMPDYVSENNKYVFASIGGWQGAPKDLINIDFELEKVLSTFKFIGSENTSEWKTHKNDVYGFEFMYPQNWKTVENPEKNWVEADPDPGHSAHFNVGVDSRSLAEIETQDKVALASGSVSKKTLKINDHNAIEYSYPEDPGDFDYYLVNNNITYHIIILITDRVQDADKILSTFKFTS